ncbi:hypothetical protein LTR86_009348 [Recurvomyces mirabilis]|nr:hypothetical protein LTR86_009348 [Recurvomyces mirabilis]
MRSIHLFSTLVPFVVQVSSQVIVTTSTTHQKIDGFGISQAFGRASEFQNAAAGLQKQALDLLFSTTSGAGFSIIRNRIGSGGSGDSIEPTSPGSPSGTPKYTFDNNDNGRVWFTKRADSYGVKTIYADAWSAPGFMKTSGSDATPGFLCGTPNHPCSSGDWRQAYANFLTKYVQDYDAAGLQITHLGFLNEPDYSPGYSQMQISTNAAEAIDFLPILSKTVKAANLNVVLTCCDAVGWGTTTNDYAPALAKAGSTQYMGVLTSHSYSADPSSLITEVSLPKWNTEGGPSGAFSTVWYSSGAANEGFTWATKLASAIVTYQLSAYLFWEGFEIKQTQSALHLVDTTDGTNATPSGVFWAFAMWSRYIRPGAQSIGVSGSPSGVVTGAFKNTDGSIVVIFTNSGSTSQTIKTSFAGSTPTAASAWVTANGKTFASTAATLSGGAVSVAVPSKGVVTVKLT